MYIFAIAKMLVEAHNGSIIANEHRYYWDNGDPAAAGAPRPATLGNRIRSLAIRLTHAQARK